MISQKSGNATENSFSKINSMILQNSVFYFSSSSHGEFATMQHAKQDEKSDV